MRPSSKTSVTIDTFATTPEHAALRDAVAAHSWPEVESSLAAMTPEQTSFAVGQLTEVEGIEALLEDAVEADPRSPMARTALAARYIVIAWEVRTRNVAKHVSRQRFEGFFDWLTRAEELLQAVIADEPTFAPAWSTSLTTARGLQLGTEELLHRYSRVEALSAGNYYAQVQALIFLLPKWFGSWEEARDFVDAAVRAAPSGSATHALVPLLHIERWSGTDNIRENLAQLDAPELIVELRAASARFLAGGAPLDPARVAAHSAFAMMFWLGHFFDDAAVHFRVLDTRASEFPWRYLTDSERKLTSIRDKALKKAKR